MGYEDLYGYTVVCGFIADAEYDGYLDGYAAGEAAERLNSDSYRRRLSATVDQRDSLARQLQSANDALDAEERERDATAQALLATATKLGAVQAELDALRAAVATVVKAAG